MHLGNAFTALLAYLSVRAQNGTLLLRIEDLDPARCKPEYAQILRDDLHWLGLDWDAEMPPQSQRSALYEAQFARLWKTGQVYPCFCSRDALHDASAPHAARRHAPPITDTAAV
jgi:glutamyl-tRNA synthetase